MAVLFDNTSGQIFTASASWVVTKPAHVHDGDLIIATVVEDGTGAITVVPAGFTIIGALQAVPGADAELRVYWKIAASEPASWTWTWSGSEAGQVEITTYTGHHVTTPVGGTVNVDYKHGDTGGGATTAVAAGPITPPIDDCMIVAAICSDPGVAYTMTATAPATERVDRINALITWVGLLEWLQTTAASVTLNATITASDNFAWNVFAIRPAAAPASTFVPQVMVVT